MPEISERGMITMEVTSEPEYPQLRILRLTSASGPESLPREQKMSAGFRLRLRWEKVKRRFYKKQSAWEQLRQYVSENEEEEL